MPYTSPMTMADHSASAAVPAPAVDVEDVLLAQQADEGEAEGEHGVVTRCVTVAYGAGEELHCAVSGGRDLCCALLVRGEGHATQLASKVDEDGDAGCRAPESAVSARSRADQHCLGASQRSGQGRGGRRAEAELREEEDGGRGGGREAESHRP